MEENRIEQRLVDDKIPYAEALRSGKWINRSDSEVNVEPTLMVEGPIHIDDNISTISEVLKRSLVGFFEVRDENYPTLSEIKRWTSSIWKINHGLNIYEMGKGRFLFEFASRFTAEHVITGDWTRNETFLRLEWWSPASGTVGEGDRPSTTWTRVVGLPLHLWSEKVFRTIRNLCGGWIETEEETKLRNHLKWARIRVQGDGSKIPKEVSIKSAGMIFVLQLWTETPARLYTGEDKGPNPSVQQISALCPKDNKGKPAADSLKSHASLVQQVPVLYPKENKGKPAIDRL
ncbi:hypothetical protein KY285_030334 [Solanum tuberosum]|nr:hypothetical protein KY289_030460 [Solanum tuberosum]KAH0655452.1 hypothetical protein KY285_030334 [Solanum tuberosum]